MGGTAYPAHIDREAGGLIAVLGSMPDEPNFRVVELNDSGNAEEYIRRYALQEKLVLCSSDAHNLWSINDAVNFIEIDYEPYSSSFVRAQLVKILEGM